MTPALIYLLLGFVLLMFSAYMAFRSSGAAKRKTDKRIAFASFLSAAFTLCMAAASPSLIVVWPFIVACGLYAVTGLVHDAKLRRNSPVIWPAGGSIMPRSSRNAAGFATWTILAVILVITALLYFGISAMSPTSKPLVRAGFSTNNVVTEATLSGNTRLYIVTTTDGRQLVIAEDKNGAKAVHELTRRQ